MTLILKLWRATTDFLLTLSNRVRQILPSNIQNQLRNMGWTLRLASSPTSLRWR